MGRPQLLSDQMEGLKAALEAANDRWEHEQARQARSQRLQEDQEQTMSQEIQELSAITEQLRLPLGFSWLLLRGNFISHM